MRLVPDVRRIGVLRANALGDFIFVLPALEALRAAYPEAELVLLGAPWHATALSGRPGPVDRVMVVPASPGIREPQPEDPELEGELAGFWEKARAEEFDLALQLHGGGRHSNPIVASLGARVTAGLRARDAPALDRTIPYVFYQPEVFRYLEVAELVGAQPVTYRPRFALSAADHEQAARVAPPGAGPRVVLHAGATDARRRWPAERFGLVGRALLQQGVDVFVSGTPSEADLVSEVCDATGPGARRMVGQLSLPGFAAFLADSDVLISNDTGPLHLAAAVGTAVVGMFWVGNMINCAPVDRARYRPLVSWTIHCPQCGMDCTRELYPERGGQPACEHRVSFVEDIPVAEVLSEVEDLLGAVVTPARPMSAKGPVGETPPRRVAASSRKPGERQSP
jgi:ADP-heptose:LPS heptosyltransferase